MNLNRLPCAAYDGNLISLMFYFYDVPAPGSFMQQGDGVDTVRLKIIALFSQEPDCSSFAPRMQE